MSRITNKQRQKFIERLLRPAPHAGSAYIRGLQVNVGKLDTHYLKDEARRLGIKDLIGGVTVLLGLCDWNEVVTDPHGANRVNKYCDLDYFEEALKIFKDSVSHVMYRLQFYGLNVTQSSLCFSDPQFQFIVNVMIHGNFDRLDTFIATEIQINKPNATLDVQCCGRTCVIRHNLGKPLGDLNVEVQCEEPYVIQGSGGPNAFAVESPRMDNISMQVFISRKPHKINKSKVIKLREQNGILIPRGV